MIVGKEFSSEDIANELKLKPPRTRQLLNELVKIGLMSTVGTTKNRRYIRK